MFYIIKELGELINSNHLTREPLRGHWLKPFFPFRFFVVIVYIYIYTILK